MSTAILERSKELILDRKELETKAKEILKAIKETLPEVTIDEEDNLTYTTESSKTSFFTTTIVMNETVYTLYIDQVIDDEPKVIILVNPGKIAMFNIDDTKSVINYINHGDTNNLYKTKMEKDYNYLEFIFTRYAYLSGSNGEKNFKALNEYIKKNTIVKTPEERRTILEGIEEVKPIETPVNPFVYGVGVAVEDIIRNASSGLAQSTIQSNIVMDTRVIPDTINPMEIIPGPNDNTEQEDMDEESKKIFDRIVYAPSSLIPDPKNPDLTVPAIRLAMEERRKKAEKEIEQYKKSIENVGKRTPLSNRVQ